MPALNPEPLSLSSYLDDPDHPFYTSHNTANTHHSQHGHHAMHSAGGGWGGDRTPPSVCSSEATIASMQTTAPTGSGGGGRKGGGRGGSGDSPSDFLFDRPRSPDPINDVGHRHEMGASAASMEEQRAMLILTGGGNSAASGVGGVLCCGTSSVGSVVTSPQLSPASVCTGGSEHHMALSPLSAQSSQSSTNSLSYTTCGSTMSQQLLPPALPIAPPPPHPRTPQSTRKRKSPPTIKEDQRSVHSSPHVQHSPHIQHGQQQQHHSSNGTPDKLLSSMPAFTPSPLGATTHHSTPSPLLIDTQQGSLAPPPTATAGHGGRDDFWHSLSMLQSQPPLSMSSSCANSPVSSHGSPMAISHHQFFHPSTRIHSTPPLVLSSPANQQPTSSFLPSPLHGISPLHSLHIYSPTHGQSSHPTPITGSPPPPLFPPNSASSSAASSASPPSAVSSMAVAATPSSSLSFVSPHFTCPLPVVSVSLDCSLLEATPAFFSLFHIPSPSHLAHLSLFSLLHAGSCMRVLSALLSLAEGECEREAVGVKGCKLSADAIIRTGMKSMNPQQQQQQQAQQLRTAAPVSATQSNGSSSGVVAAVIGGGGSRPATAFSFEQRTGGGGSVDKGSAAMAATNTSSILLHLAVDSCAFALHSMLDSQRRTPTAASLPPTHSGGVGGDLDSGSDFELTSQWLGGVFPVSALCFDCQLLIAPVVDAAGSMHRFMVVVNEVKRRPTSAADEDIEESERDERLRDMVEERVRRWREGNGGKKRRKRAKVDRSITAATKKLSVLAAIKRETSNGSNSSGSQPARKLAKTSEGKRKMDE